MDWTIFWTNFLDHFKGGSTPLVLREGWDEVYQYCGKGWETECYYPGWGERRTITAQGRVEGGCNSKHYWLMELLLDRTKYFNCIFD